MASTPSSPDFKIHPSIFDPRDVKRHFNNHSENTLLPSSVCFILFHGTFMYLVISTNLEIYFVSETGGKSTFEGCKLNTVYNTVNI